MRIGSITIFLFMFTASMYCVNAQQKIFKNYTVNDGLISNEIRRIFQDSKGFLWIGTLEGLSEYDGNTFTNFSTSNGLSHNMVNDFYETEKGGLFVALNNGSIDEIKDDKIIPDTSKSTIVVNKIFKTPWLQLIGLTDGNGFQVFKKGKLIILPQGRSNASYFSAIILTDSSFGITDNFSFMVFNKEYKLLSALKITDYPYSEIRSYKDSRERVWVMSHDGIKLIVQKTGETLIRLNDSLPVAFQFLKKYLINDIFEDKEENLWFATTAGIVKAKPDGTHQVFTTKDGLSSNIINTILEDKEENIWFGTAAGLSKLVTKSGISIFPVENGLWNTDNQFLMYPYKKGHFLVSTFNGTMDFNKSTGIFSPAFKESDEHHFFSVISNIYPFVISGTNKTIILDTILMKSKLIPSLSYPNSLRAIVQDKMGYRFSANINSLFFISENGPQKILDYRVKNLLIDRNNYLWVGTLQNGLFRFRYEVVKKNLKILEAKYFLPGAAIRSLYEDSKGDIWVGTRYTGVFRINKNEHDSFNILNITQTDGLTSNYIRAIREDTDGNYWIAFFQGLDKLIPKGNKFQIFNFSKVNNYYASVLGIETGDSNTVWLATREGIVKINDNHLEKSPPLPVYITKIYASDTTFPIHSLLQFNYKQKNLAFEYSSPGYINEKQILYSYRLKGSNEEAWSKASNQHSVSFAGLQPGKYQFQVKSLGWNGAWGQPAILNFVITPPFWQTWWFISLILLSVGVLIYLFFKWRIKNIRTVEAEKLKVQELNAEQLKNQLELEQVINYFSTSLIDKNDVDDVLWDVAKNLIGKLGFVDCMIYLWNDDKTRMVQKAGFGPKGTLEEINKLHFDVQTGQGVVGQVMQTKEPVIIPDTSKDKIYRAEEMIRSSEITVPIIYNNELIGVIDSEHPQRDFFTSRHLHIMNTIAALIANKIKSFEAEQSLLNSRIEIYSINDQLSKAKLEALRSQMNPHFIFNCINSIDALIQSNDKYYATVYLNKFAKLLRNILDSSKQNTVSLSKDLETLKLYIELEQFRNENKFSATIEADEYLLQDDYKIPPLIVQPFVENSILHGLRYRNDNDGKLSIHVNKQLGCIKYIIEDNGVGRNNHIKQIQKDKISYGITMSSERVRLFNNEEKASVTIIDLFETGKPSGTRVEVSLKIEE